MEERWIFGLRWIPEIDVDRAELRTTLAYRFTERFQAGVEYNPLDDDVGPIANWRLVDETERRPALIVGTSSDRIGTTHGRSVYATLSKDLEELAGAPVAPYAGVTWGDFEDEWRAIGGLVVRWGAEWQSYHMWDGVNLHHMLETSRFGPHRLGLMLAEVDDDHYLGLTYNVGFSMPWE